MSEGIRAGFQVWVRRADVPEAPFSLRFEVVGGKGILRVARPGVLIDPPARPAGTEERLTGAQLRQSRFLHIRDGGRDRVAFGLARIEDSALDRLPPADWVELLRQDDGAAHFLVMPTGTPEADDDDPTNPARSVLRDLTRDLRQIVERTRVVGQIEEEELLEADSFTAEDTLDTLDTLQDILAVGGDGEDDEDENDPFTDVGGMPPPERGGQVAWSQAPMEFDAGAWDVEAFDEAPEEEPTGPKAAVAENPRLVAMAEEPPTPRVGVDAIAPAAAPTLVVALVEEAAPPELCDPALLIHPRSTTLVRHFRRRIAVLEARVEALEAELAEARAGR